MIVRFRSFPLRFLFAAALFSVLVFSSSLGSAAQRENQATSQKKGSVQFNQDIAPIFQSSCGKCHSGNASMGRLQLDSEAAILAGGASGPAITPGHSSNSLL